LFEAFVRTDVLDQYSAFDAFTANLGAASSFENVA